LQGKRLERINALILSELGRIISTRLKDSRLGFATVSRVETTPDLKGCKVFFSVIGTDKEAQSTLAALEHSEGFIKREISNTLKLRFTPKLYFKLETHLEESIRLEQVFKKINEEK